MAASLGMVDSNMRSCILVETWLTITLSCLSSGSTLKMCGEVYGMALNIILSLLKIFVQPLKSTWNLS